MRHPFLADVPKTFLKAPLVPIYNNFEEGACAKKNATFWVKFLQNTIFGLFFFFKILPAAQKLWPNQGLFTNLGELEKKVDKILYLAQLKTLETVRSKKISFSVSFEVKTAK